MKLGLGIRRWLARSPLDPARIDWPFDIYSWFAELRPEQWVLDIGSGEGSFPWTGACHMVALDENLDAFAHAKDRASGTYHRVFGRCDRLPFHDHSVDLVLCHHVLEHLVPLDTVLAEIGRVLKPGGRLFVAVPNGYGLCDAVYRFVFEGGGHVNRLSRDGLVTDIERAVGLRLVRWQKLYSSFAHLRRLIKLRAVSASGLSLRLRMLRSLPGLVAAAQWSLYLGTRMCDRVLGTDLAVYGWAMYFGQADGPAVEERSYVNVCLHCGAGHHSLALARPYRLRYRCPICDRVNLYTRPFRHTV
jgi:SAM-dependent methyltransferase